MYCATDLSGTRGTDRRGELGDVAPHDPYLGPNCQKKRTARYDPQKKSGIIGNFRSRRYRSILHKNSRTVVRITSYLYREKVVGHNPESFGMDPAYPLSVVRPALHEPTEERASVQRNQRHDSRQRRTKIHHTGYGKDVVRDGKDKGNRRKAPVDQHDRVGKALSAVGVMSARYGSTLRWTEC